MTATAAYGRVPENKQETHHTYTAGRVVASHREGRREVARDDIAPSPPPIHDLVPRVIVVASTAAAPVPPPEPPLFLTTAAAKKERKKGHGFPRCAGSARLLAAGVPTKTQT